MEESLSGGRVGGTMTFELWFKIESDGKVILVIIGIDGIGSQTGEYFLPIPISDNMNIDHVSYVGN